MALTERYTLELAEAFEPYRVYWMEECLPPDDYEGFGRLRQQIKSTRIVTGEHVYTRYGFRQLLEHVLAQGAVESSIGLRLYVDEHNHSAIETYRRFGFESGAYRVMERLLHSG